MGEKRTRFTGLRIVFTEAQVYKRIACFVNYSKTISCTIMVHTPMDRQYTKLSIGIKIILFDEP